MCPIWHALLASSFTEERGARGIEGRWRFGIEGEKFPNIFIIVQLLRPLKDVYTEEGV